MIQNNYFSDNQDIQNHFEHILPWTEIILDYENEFPDPSDGGPANPSETKEYYKTLLNTVGDLAGNILSPHVAKLDREGLKFKEGKVEFPPKMLELVSKVIEAGVQAYGFSRKYGELGIPWTVKSFISEIFYRVDTSLAIAIGCVNLAEILEHHATREMKEEWIPKLAAGKFVCAMGLTEPDHGSDLSNLRTKATKDKNGNWVLNGTKRFITHGCGFGDIPAILLTLARSGKIGSGARGLSLFLVQSKNVQIAGIERKLGLHCSPTCEVVFENSPGLLIGEEGLGLVKYTMGMLNGARMGIAQQSTGLATAAYYEALKYTKERIQFGKPLIEIPAVKKIIDRIEREMYAMRCLTLEGSRVMDRYYWRTFRLKKQGATEREAKNDIVVHYWEKIADILTPISKFYCSETCLKVVSDALQIHGGSGYTEDYDISRIYRDARITTIYDGTSQIQINACIGGITSGLTHSFGEYVSELVNRSDFSLTHKLFREFQELVFLYKNFSKKENKDIYAEEVVFTCSRFLAGILLELSCRRLPEESKQVRLKLTKDYHLDTLFFLEGNLAKLKEANRVSI
ncbi:acyl-CoA dehydrogenase, C-terminal domain protein [Leptospira borgpetersenii serovar Hardjo-bovis str. Sponselee]|uniref:Acyl-CoA dehydrogenase, C-terminal domain protein n=1 Tax=Leptospira borgpetersenii serovar Hardjo-bovis str. Sponselee TaxID=1303729 RepID=M6BNH2_LEPBO|nr:acyl-CoA dehydrogenase family protein [Leptospira borgpetersenii]AYR07532.1 acyl-CoA dehydrogenase [Leptospira borgpetersenii serovar Hardjo-bovis]EMJ77883.1 acyl-CoA dehydrogenase, C-terminal domain protein [Leptospira borgpetersenii serovar Hardjo-bovis str. Sponselee]